MNEDKFATELISEIKSASKRWFIVALVELILILSMSAGFLWYISLPVEDTTISQDAEDSGTNQVIGGDYNGKTDSTQNKQEKS